MHFLDLNDFDAKTLKGIVDTARRMKQARAGQPKGLHEKDEPLKGKALALIFERPSTRTRVSFEMAMKQLGGEVIVLSAHDMQLGRGETIPDTARVLSRYVDGIMLRASTHNHLTELAQHATVPVINGLTDLSHPCQVMADVLTLEERKGPLARQHVSWVGDGNNVAASWIHAVGVMGGKLTLGCPEPLNPTPEVMAWAKTVGADVSLTASPETAVKDSDCVITDCWVSMGDKDEGRRQNLLRRYQVNAALMDKAGKDAIFMHCLPATRGEEVTDEVMDGPQSAVFDEAENRLHAQKAVLAWVFGAAVA